VVEPVARQIRIDTDVTHMTTEQIKAVMARNEAMAQQLVEMLQKSE
jgi:hypothetical protein